MIYTSAMKITYTIVAAGSRFLNCSSGLEWTYVDRAQWCLLLVDLQGLLTWFLTDLLR